MPPSMVGYVQHIWRAGHHWLHVLAGTNGWISHAVTVLRSGACMNSIPHASITGISEGGIINPQALPTVWSVSPCVHITTTCERRRQSNTTYSMVWYFPFQPLKTQQQKSVYQAVMSHKSSTVYGGSKKHSGKGVQWYSAKSIGDD